ncbi:hypothetical protein FO519_000850 [Halicephalobus sp. NKZ332]|nr:hypothetical protein FO519_000850 [Halicephalobus sp. NKZ332]
MPSKHCQSNKARKRKGRDIDEIYNDIQNKKTKVLDAEDRLDLPADGQFFCKTCERYFINQKALEKHERSKPHKNQLKRLAEPMYTVEDSLIAAGLGKMITVFRRLSVLNPTAYISRSLSTSATHSGAASDSDEPIQLDQNPYEKPKRKCLLCEHKIELDYKNTRLLQQFISTFSGRVYERHVTGLCTHQYKQLLETIALSRRAGYMPIFVKDPKYLNDPKLFDPLKPRTPHSYA